MSALGKSNHWHLHQWLESKCMFIKVRKLPICYFSKAFCAKVLGGGWRYGG